MEQKPRKPFYQSVWLYAIIGIIVVRFILPDSDSKKYREYMDDAEASFEKGDIAKANSLIDYAAELRPDGTRLEELNAKIKKEEKKRIVKKKAEEKKEVDQKKETDRKQAIASWLDNYDTPLSRNAAEKTFVIFGSDYQKPQEVVRNVSYDQNEKVLTITTLGADGWSDKSIGLGFYEDSAALYRELADDQQINEIWITILFPMKDAYGKVKEEEVMGTWMSRETLDKIEWKTFDYQKLLDAVDGKTIYPQFVQ